MENQLNEVFNDTVDNTDNDFLIRIINTVLDNNTLCSKQDKLSYFSYLNELLYDLIKEQPLTRPNIKEMIYDLKDYTDNYKYKPDDLIKLNFIDLIKKYVNRDKNDYNVLYVLCYGRLLFECYYTEHIYYMLPTYAAEEALGRKTSWYIFMDAIKHNHAIIL